MELRNTSNVLVVPWLAVHIENQGRLLDLDKPYKHAPVAEV